MNLLNGFWSDRLQIFERSVIGRDRIICICMQILTKKKWSACIFSYNIYDILKIYNGGLKFNVISPCTLVTTTYITLQYFCLMVLTNMQ